MADKSVRRAKSAALLAGIEAQTKVALGLSDTPFLPAVNPKRIAKSYADKLAPTLNAYGVESHSDITPALMDALLGELSRHNSMTQACIDLNISRTQVYRLVSIDPEFKQRFADAKVMGADAWEDEASRRAFRGYEKGVYHMGVKVDTETVYSDTLASLLLKAAKPAKYATRSLNDTNVSGTVAINLATMSDAELDAHLSARLAIIDVQAKVIRNPDE